MRRSVPLLAVALLLAACAGETAAVTTVAETSTTTLLATTTSAPATSTTVPGTTATTEPAIDVEISGGQVAGPDRFHVGRGEVVEITILSDTAYEIHVHGYDLRYDLEPGEPSTIEFTADVPGIFEVESHPDHLVIFDIEVAG